MEGRTDEALARDLKAGSRTAAAELFQRHYGRIWKAALAITGRRVLADEAAGDCFVRMIERIDQYDESRRFQPWLHGIAAHRALDLLRREGRIRLPGDLEDESAEWDAPADDGEFVARLATLSSERRAVVVLRYGLDLGPEEIAGVLDVAVGTVHSRLARALAQLREEGEVRADAG
jgi:RNA polymerase sigma-70 factor, ECF subfamily